MLYYSELEGKQIFTEDNIKIGTLNDIIFKPSEQAKVTKIVIKSVHKNKFILPFKFVYKINTSIHIQKSFQISELEENELFIKKNLLDKQIIDLSGNKIVRVNDVILHENVTSGLTLTVSGVDVGWLGLTRRIKIESYISRLFHKLHIPRASVFLSWADIQPLDLMRGKVVLKKEEDKLDNLRPEDLADYLEQTNERNIRRFLKILEPKRSVEVVSNLNLNYQKDLFQHWIPEKCAQIIQNMEPDKAVDALLTVSRRKRESILALIEEKKRNIFSNLISFSKTPIGKRMTPIFFTINSSATVKDTIQKIKNDTHNFTFFATIYVVNNNNQLVGVVNLHELLMQSSETPLYKFMIQNLIVANLMTPIELVIRKIVHYRLPAIPIVDSNKKMLGIVTFDDIVDIISKKLFPSYA